MVKEKIIIVEGPQGVGKTTFTDYIRNTMPFTNLYRLSGISDNTRTGLQKSIRMYDDLLEYMKKMENSNINLLFDRTFFTEENYCRLGYKDYSFTEEYNKLVRKLDNLDFDIYYINLFLDDKLVFENRLKRDGKVNVKYAKFNIENSIKQQEMYQILSDELKKKTKNIKVIDFNNNISESDMKEKINKLFNIGNL